MNQKAVSAGRQTCLSGRQGFSQLILMIVIGATLVFGGGSFWYYQQSAEQDIKSAPETQAIPESSPAPAEPPKQQTSTIPVPAATKEPIPRAIPKPSFAPTSAPKLTPAVAPAPTPPPLPPAPVLPPPPLLINGKTLEVRLAEAHDRLHTSGSGDNVRQNFPDIALVYTDDGAGAPFPSDIIPFNYYYSSEADTTFSICKPERTTFICKGKLDRLIKRGDLDSGRCELTPLLSGDPRL